MGYSGSTFIWTNLRTSNNLILERLNKALCNLSQHLLYPETFIFHLPRIIFDHCLMLVSCHSLIHPTLQRPFRFQTCWLSHPQFYQIVNFVQNPSNSLDKIIQNFIEKVSQWNKNVFGNAFKGKNKILAKINGLQRVLNSSNSKTLKRLEKSL